MTSSPQHLHASANLWSLWNAVRLLAQAAQNASGASGDDRGTVQAWRPGSGVHTGRASDAVLDAIIRNGGVHANPYAERAECTGTTMAWVAASLGLPPAEHVVPALIDAVPGLRLAAAGSVALWAGSEDRAVRRLLGSEDRAVRRLLVEPADHQLVAVMSCPYCHTPGALAIRTSHPDREQRPVVCTAGCTCDGPGCRCGMSVGVEQLPHIWTRDELIAAFDAQQAAA